MTAPATIDLAALRQSVANVEQLALTVLAAASLQQPAAADRTQWDARLRRLLRVEAFARAQEHLGRYAIAQRRLELAQMAVNERYGIGYRPDVPGEAFGNERWRELQDALDAARAAELERKPVALDPMAEARRDLILTPAPDVFAARLKIELLIREGYRDWLVGQELMQLVADDMARLLQAEVDSADGSVSS